MDPRARPQHLSHEVRLPLVGAVAIGGLVAGAFLVMPTAMLEDAVLASGIPAILAAAEPPLGFTARIALALVCGGLAATFTWFGLGVLPEDRPIDLSPWSRRLDMTKLTALLRRKSYADGAPRPPLFATRELGTPFLDVKAPAEPLELEDFALPLDFTDFGPPPERDLPRDLDQPLAAYDPGAVPAQPLPAQEPLAPLARPQLIDPGDRFETFELTPVQRQDPPADAVEQAAPVPLAITPEPAAVVAPQTETTIHALLARLERGLAANPVPPAVEPAPPAAPEPEAEPVASPAPTLRPGSLQDTLSDLRRLATGGH